jgi:hypothetical protein
MSRDTQISTLEKLIDENHSHLVSLGVGHAALEAVKAKTGEQPWGLHTKLTGAGGGGCAVTIIPDGDSAFCLVSTPTHALLRLSSTRLDFSEASLLDLKAALADAGFVTYETTVGGSGFGLLSHAKSGAAPVEAEGGAEKLVLPDVARFRGATGAELAEWAEAEVGWAFV